MRLYLINPCNPLTGLRRTWKGRWNRHRAWQPLGLMVVAGATPDTWDVSILDENTGDVDYAALPTPDLVGITAFTCQAPRAYELSALYRRIGVPVVMGGIHASVRPDEATRHMDSVVTGEADAIWPQVLEDARKGTLRQRYDGGIVASPDVSPARHDLLPRRYALGAVQTSRGCPLRCDFCSVAALHGARYRMRAIADVIAELRNVRERRVLVVDDNLVGVEPDHTMRAKELFRAMIAADLHKEWIGYVCINFADDEELITLASKAGCRAVGIGFETPSPEGLSELGKRFNLLPSHRDWRSAIQRIQRHKILVVGAFMIGLDSDESGVGRRIADTGIQLGLDLLNVCFLTPLPGSRLWTRMEAENRIVLHNYPADWRYYTLTFPVARPKRISMADIIEEMLACDRAFYSMPQILRRSGRALVARRHPLLGLAANLSFRQNLRGYYETSYTEFQRTVAMTDSPGAHGRAEEVLRGVSVTAAPAQRQGQ